MIRVVATLELHPGQRPAFLQAFLALTPLVRAEDGCIEYGACTEIASDLPPAVRPREDVLIVIETWRDEASLVAHLAAPHVTSFLQANGPLLKNVSLQVLRPAS